MGWPQKGVRKYRFPYSWERKHVLISDLTHLLTSAPDGNKWPASHADYFTPRKGFPVPIELEAEWIPEPVWMLSLRGHLCSSHESNHALILELCLVIALRESNTSACPFGLSVFHPVRIAVFLRLPFFLTLFAFNATCGYKPLNLRPLTFCLTPPAGCALLRQPIPFPLFLRGIYFFYLRLFYLRALYQEQN